MSLTLRVLGTPAPQGSKRHVGKGILVESSKAVGPWREAIVSAAIREDIAGTALDGPLSLSATFWLPRPAGHSGKRGLLPSAPTRPHRKPDLDKLLRSTMDGIVQAGLIADDARIVQINAAKHYADWMGTPPGALIVLTELEES